VPGSSYHFEEAWRDPTCTERPPPAGAGVNTVLIPSPANGVYQVDVTNPSGGDTAAASYVYDRNGKLKLDTHSGGNAIHFQIDYDGGTPATTATATPTTTATGQGTNTPTPAPPATRTPTRVPARPTDVPPPPTEPPPPPPTDVPTTAPANPPTATQTPTRTPTSTPPTPTLTPTPTPVPGSLTITQTNGPTQPGFGLAYTGDLGNFTLLTGQSRASGPLAPGVYSVTQSFNRNYYVSSLSCYFAAGGTPTRLILPPEYAVSADSATVTVTLRAAQNVICNYDEGLTIF